MKGWKKHRPGDQPVADGVLVDVSMENGDILRAIPAEDIDWDCPGDQVKHYRLCSKEKDQ